VPEESLLECPCHFSRFDPKRNATVMVGPATRRLPKLGLTADNGRLVVAKVFDGKIGGDADDA
jgi:rieske iron-sulfur protein